MKGWAEWSVGVECGRRVDCSRRSSHVPPRLVGEAKQQAVPGRTLSHHTLQRTTHSRTHHTSDPETHTHTSGPLQLRGRVGQVYVRRHVVQRTRPTFSRTPAGCMDSVRPRRICLILQVGIAYFFFRLSACSSPHCKIVPHRIVVQTTQEMRATYTDSLRVELRCWAAEPSHRCDEASGVERTDDSRRKKSEPQRGCSAGRVS